MNAGLPAGWIVDETGEWRRETIHHMGRRCRNWNYCGTGAYMITLVLNDRKSAVLGHVTGPFGSMVLSALGKEIEGHAKRIGDFSPGIDVIGVQVMPDHLHLVLRVRRRLARPLGEHLRGFKIGCTKLAREMCFGIDAEAQDGDAGPCVRGCGLFAEGFVDTILGDEKAVEKALAYLSDNPRRLYEKRTHPDLFRIVSDLSIRLALDGHDHLAHFSAIGNRHLLDLPHLVQVQCSRRDFAYARDLRGRILITAPPLAKTARFDECLADLMAAAEHGSVLVSPCISEGEREIARNAFDAGYRVITLANKGFSPLYKPGGRLFDTCAKGNLLMLAPAEWPYLPGEKRITRIDACALNRIAQLLCGSGATKIDYKGVRPEGIERLVAEATKAVPL